VYDCHNRLGTFPTAVSPLPDYHATKGSSPFMTDYRHDLIAVPEDFLDTVQGALDQDGVAQSLIDGVLSRGLRTVYLVGCGGSHFGTYPAFEVLDRFGSAFWTQRLTSAELTSRDPVRLGEQSLVIAASHSGNTPETVAAARFAKQAGATVVGISRAGENGLAAAADLHLSYDSNVTVTEPKLVHFQQLALALLEGTGAGADVAATRQSMKALPDALYAIKHEIAETGEKVAELVAQAPLTYTVGAGAPYGAAKMMAWCYFQEMQWMHAAAINGADFFHGPFEMAGKGTPLIALVAEDAARPLGQRVLDFGAQYVESFAAIDTARLTLPGISPQARRDLSLIALFSAERRVLDHVAARRGHDTSQRRYMYKVVY